MALSHIRKALGLIGQILCSPDVIPDTLQKARTIGKDPQLGDDRKGPENCQLHTSDRLEFKSRGLEEERRTQNKE